MTSRQWLASVLLGVTVLSLAVGLVNYRLNAFGVFGDARGASLGSYTGGVGAVREAKYLFSLNYIPANFDGLLIGTSITGNWNTSKLLAARTYNLSIDAGNITEELILAENIFSRAKIRLVLFSIYPYLVESHGKKMEEMSSRDYWGVFGSLELLREYKDHILARMSLRHKFTDEFGVMDFSDLEHNADIAAAGRRFSEGRRVEIDDSAMRDYERLLEDARATGARVVAFIPPHPYGVWNTEEYRAFETKARALFHADEPIIDFNATEYDAIRKNGRNFYDGVHLSSNAASFMIVELNRHLLENSTLPGASVRSRLGH